jgi:hypothetical protein
MISEMTVSRGLELRGTPLEIHSPGRPARRLGDADRPLLSVASDGARPLSEPLLLFCELYRVSDCREGTAVRP